MLSPDGQKERSNIPENNNVSKNENSKNSNFIEEDKEKSISEKIHEALQEWSNDDQRDLEFDDSRP